MLQKLLLSSIIALNLFGVSANQFIDGSDYFPSTETLTATWNTTYQIQDLGYSDSVSGGNYQAAKHRYVVTYQTVVTCNRACYLGTNNGVGYNINSNQVVLFHGERFNETTYSMSAKLGFTSEGYESKTYTFSTADDTTFITLSIPGINNTFTDSIIFPALTQGIVLDSINTQLGAFNLSWEEWKQLDLEHKTYELKYMIYQMSHNGTPLNSSTQTTIDQLIESGDLDQAYTVVNNYYYAETQETNAATETAINDNESQQSSLESVTTTEQTFTEGIEDQFTNQIGDIDTENSVITNSNFQQSAVWVTDKFNRFTNNNAFGSILGFSLLLGLAMAIIGRVIK